jgi:hypothetical protein
MTEVVHTLISTDGRLRIEVVRRPTGGYQLAYSRHAQEHLPEFEFFWEGWVPMPGGVTLTDTPQRGATLAAEEMALWEFQDRARPATDRQGR